MLGALYGVVSALLAVLAAFLFVAQSEDAGVIGVLALVFAVWELNETVKRRDGGGP